MGLFKPPEELSAAVAMELLYYYALAHQTSFDVRWIKGRSIAETIIQPLADRISSTCDIDVKGRLATGPALDWQSLVCCSTLMPC